MGKAEKSRFRFHKKIAVFGVFIFIAKLIAWKLTGSNSVFSDAMESVVNILGGFMGLYSLYLSSKPKDHDHPYGHGKIEFVTSGVEGGLIFFSGIVVIVQTVISLITKNIPQRLDWGILIIAATALINYILGYISLRKGKKENSFVLESSGRHLQSDTITTGGVVGSLIIIHLTGVYWLDAVVAFIFALYIIRIGIRIIRKSVKGIMDEADLPLLQFISKLLSRNRKAEWIDIHNMRIQQFGSKLHIDAHLTLPWYFELRKAHEEMRELIILIAENTPRNIEFNIHLDDCRPLSCGICQMKDCPVRLDSFQKKIPWNAKTISQPEKHHVEN
ncbi:MAG: cation transporter [Bergeyella sp.]|nr:cation transporter [Bergeyella sp.]